MELFKILGTIAVDSADALKALKDVQQEGGNTESKLGKAFSAMGKGAAVAGKAIATGLAAGGAAMAALTTKALSASGELEQNMGGAEAVFGSLGNSIAEMSTTVITGYDEATGKAITATRSLEQESKDAYKNMGLSQSDYLATANKMGALFKGAGFETQEALDLSSQAMQRAADVASIMGIDTGAAMEAVAGAAKGNFEMMDNLGIAMNDTAIAAYAASKGINKSTQEMSQQEKIGLAMEMFLEKTSYAAGNYAKENETLAGSLSTAKAAFTNFLAGSGDVDSLVSSFSNLANVVVNSLTEIAPRLTQGISDLVQQVAPLIPPLLNTLLPVLVEGAVTLVDGLVAAMPGIVSAIMGVLPALIEGVLQLITSLATALPQIIQPIVEALPQIIQAIVTALPTLIPALIDAAVQIIVMLCEMLPQIIQPLIDALPTIISSIVEALMNNLPALIEGAIQLIMGIVTALPQILDSLNSAIIAALSGIWDGIKNVFAPLGSWFGEKFSGAKEAAVNAWSDAKEKWNGVKEKVSGAWSDLKTKFGTKFAEAKTAAEQKWADAKSKWSGIKENVVSGFSDLKSKVGTKFSEAKADAEQKWADAKSKFSSVKDKVVSAFNDLSSKVSPLFSKAKESASNTWSNVANTFSKHKTNIVNAFNDLGSKLKQKFSSALDSAKKGFDKIKQIGSDLVSGLWNGINDKFSWLTGKIKSFASNVTDKLKSFFGIKSPSRVMRDEVGRYLAEGVAEGINLNAEKAESAAEKMGDAIIKAAEERLDAFKDTNEMTLAEEAGYWEEVAKQCQEGTKARLKAEKNYLDAKKSIDNEILAAEERLQSSLTEIQNKYTERKNSILDRFELYDEDDESAFDVSLNLYSQVKTLEDYQSRIDRLQERIGGTGLYEEVKSMGLDGFKFVAALNAMSDDELQQLINLHDKRSELAESLAHDELEDEAFAAEQKAYQEFADKCDELGVEIVEDVGEIATAFGKVAELIQTSKQSFEDFAEALAGTIEIEEGAEVGIVVSPEMEGVSEALAGIAELEDGAEVAVVLKPQIVDTVAETVGEMAETVGEVVTDHTDFVNSFMGKFGGIGNEAASTEAVTDATAETLVSNYSPDNAEEVQSPAAFDYDAGSGKEITTSDYETMKASMAAQNGTVEKLLQHIIGMLGGYFPQIIEALKMAIVLDTGVLVGELAEPMNEALGRLSSRKDRGR